MLTTSLKKLVAAVLFLFLSATSQALTQSWPGSSSPEWEALFEAAAQEGEVTILASPQWDGEFVRQFEIDSGLKVNFVSGGRREGQTRFFQEVETGNPQIDVFFGGNTPIELANAGLLAPIGDYLLLPEVIEPSLWRMGKVPFTDNEQKYLPNPTQYLSGLVLVNSNLVEYEELSSWDDILSPNFTGKIISHDPRIGGSGAALFSFLAATKGLDFAAALIETKDIEFVRDYRQITDGVARGTHAIGLGAIPREIEKYRSEGLEFLEVWRMKDEVGFLTGGGGVLAIPAKAPNLHAAMVFANWYLSKNGQEITSTIQKIPSERRDVTSNDWPAVIKPDDGVEYFDSYEEEWYLVNRSLLQDSLLERVDF